MKNKEFNRIDALRWLYSAIRNDGGTHKEALIAVIASALELSRVLGNVAQYEDDASIDAEEVNTKEPK